jgi:hypothetical protein
VGNENFNRSESALTGHSAVTGATDLRSAIIGYGTGGLKVKVQKQKTSNQPQNQPNNPKTNNSFQNPHLLLALNIPTIPNKRRDLKRINIFALGTFAGGIMDVLLSYESAE